MVACHVFVPIAVIGLLRRWFVATRFAIFAAAAVATVGVGLPAAQAQQAETYLQAKLPPNLQDPTSAEVRRARNTVLRMLQNREPYNRDFAVNWYKLYVFARMTQLANMDELSAWRAEMEQDMTTAFVRTPQVHTDLVNLTRDEMKKIMSQNYHPAVRTNACLLLGNLNRSEPRGAPPVPLPEALVDLVAALDDPQQLDAVRAAALVGIERHVDLRTRFPQLGALTAEQATAIGQALAKLAQQTEPPPGRNQPGHDWMRETSVKILGRLGAAGNGGAYVAAVQAALDDPRAGLELRTAAARALGRMQLADAGNVDAAKLTSSIIALAVTCCDTELALMGDVLSSEDRQFAVASSSPPSATETPRGRDAEIPFADPTSVPHRRRLASRLHRIRLGLAGDRNSSTVASFAEANGQGDLVKRATTAVDALLTLLSDRATTLETLQPAVAERRAALAALVPQAPSAPANPDAISTPSSDAPTTTTTPELPF